METLLVPIINTFSLEIFDHQGKCHLLEGSCSSLCARFCSFTAMAMPKGQEIIPNL